MKRKHVILPMVILYVIWLVLPLKTLPQNEQGLPDLVGGAYGAHLTLIAYGFILAVITTVLVFTVFPNSNSKKRY